MDLKTLRLRIHNFFETRFGFKYDFCESECYENELLFTLLICNTFDKVKKMKQNKKVKQGERKEDISLHIIALRDDTPKVTIIGTRGKNKTIKKWSLDDHIRKVFENPCIPHMSAFFANPAIRTMWKIVRETKGLKEYLSFVRDCQKLEWYRKHIEAAAPEGTIILP